MLGPSKNHNLVLPMKSETIIDPFEVVPLEKALNDSASRVATIWVSLVVFGLYLAIASGGVTQEQLLLGSAIKLPVLNVDLPLAAFFFLAPILLFIFHIYVLIQLVLLGRTAGEYNIALDRDVGLARGNAVMRQRLVNTLFAQMLAGSPRERSGGLGWLLRFVAWTTLSAAPVLILLLIQFKFLPYHSEWITWSHRILIITDLYLSFVLWGAAFEFLKDVNWLKPLAHPAALATLVLCVIVTLSVFTFPGESHINIASHKQLDNVDCERWFYFGQSVDSQRNSNWGSLIFFDRINLPRAALIDEKSYDRMVSINEKRLLPPYGGARTQVLRNRNLTCAELPEADLRRVDLTGARLSEANLMRADLSGALLNSASLDSAGLSSAIFDGASLAQAQLQSANLMGAQLRGVVMRDAQLAGGFLYAALLSGANLERSDLKAAMLDSAELQGATLTDTHLEGSSFNGAHLEGAQLSGANISGASLRLAQLQGSDLADSVSVATDFESSYVWRSEVSKCEKAHVVGINGNQVLYITNRWQSSDPEYNYIVVNNEEVPASAQVVDKLVDAATNYIYDQARKKSVTDHLHAALSLGNSSEDTKRLEAWRQCQEGVDTSNKETFYKDQIATLRDIICGQQVNQLAILKGVIRNWILYNEKASVLPRDNDVLKYKRQMAQKVMTENPELCPAVGELDQETRDKLTAFVGDKSKP
jgi:uncharacterized protein YjbI with pentapeptide repeats